VAAEKQNVGILEELWDKLKRKKNNIGVKRYIL
jgi:hypothetical protein